MKRLFLAPAFLASLVLLSGCSNTLGSNDSTKGTETTTESSSPAGEWVTVSTVTADTVEQDPTLNEVTAFLMQVTNGGTLTVNMPAKDGDQPYTVETSLKGDRWMSVTTREKKEVYSAGDDKQTCGTEPFELGTVPTLEDWECESGRPSGGNDFDIFAGYGWLGTQPSLYFEGGIYGYAATEGVVERDGDTVRLTVTGLGEEGDKAVITYDLDSGTVTQAWASGKDGVLSMTYTPEILREWPELPPLATN